MKKETLKVVKAVARKLQPVPPPKTHKAKKEYKRHEKHRVAFREESGLFFQANSRASCFLGRQSSATSRSISVGGILYRNGRRHSCHRRPAICCKEETIARLLFAADDAH